MVIPDRNRSRAVELASHHQHVQGGPIDAQVFLHIGTREPEEQCRWCLSSGEKPCHPTEGCRLPFSARLGPLF